MSQFTLPSGAKPLENPSAFNHQGLAASGASIPSGTAAPFIFPMQNTVAPAPAPVAVPVAAPAPVAPRLTREEYAQASLNVHPASVQAKEPKERYSILNLPNTYEGCWELAERLSKSAICPVAARNPADVFVMLAKAEALGMAWPEAFTNFYVMPNAKTGEIKLCMYVKTKEGVCRKYGSWQCEVDLMKGEARAWGKRYSDGVTMEVTFSGFDASLRGRLKRENGQVIGVGPWADKWPDMLQVRAIGRLLDRLFPDVIGGFTSYEEMTDTLLEAELKREATNSESENKADAILNKTRRNKRTVKTEEPAPTQGASLENFIESTTELTADETNPLA